MSIAQYIFIDMECFLGDLSFISAYGIRTLKYDEVSVELICIFSVRSTHTGTITIVRQGILQVRPFLHKENKNLYMIMALGEQLNRPTSLSCFYLKLYFCSAICAENCRTTRLLVFLGFHIFDKTTKVFLKKLFPYSINKLLPLSTLYWISQSNKSR